MMPIETMHALRAALHERMLLQETAAVSPRPDAAAATEEEQQKKSRLIHDLLANMDASMLANAIIKNEAEDRRMYTLAIARRLRYCLEA